MIVFLGNTKIQINMLFFLNLHRIKQLIRINKNEKN